MSERKRINLLLVSLFSVLVMMIGLPNLATAEEAQKGGGAEFGVSAIYPENQVAATGKQGYFDIRVKPGTKQDLKIKITNYSKKQITVKADLNRGLTTGTGSITYETPKKEDKYKLNADHDFYSMASTKEKEIVLEPEKSKDFVVTINLPEKEFDGMVLGGIHFTQKVDEKSKKDQNQVMNAFAYSVPIVMTENDKPIKKDFSFKKVYPSLRNYHPFIEAVFSNDTPNIINRLQVDAKIVDAKTKESLYTSKKDDLQMAPLSDYSFGFDLRDSPIVAGKYQLHMKIDADGEKREFTEDFEISKKDADKINEDSVIDRPENNKMLWIIIIVAVVVLVLLVIIGVVIHLKKKKKKAKSKKGKTKKAKEVKKSKHSSKSKSSSKKRKNK